MKYIKGKINPKLKKFIVNHIDNKRLPRNNKGRIGDDAKVA